MVGDCENELLPLLRRFARDCVKFSTPFDGVPDAEPRRSVSLHVADMIDLKSAAVVAVPLTKYACTRFD